MSTVKAFIRTTNKGNKKVNIRFRLTDGRNIQLFHKSEFEVLPDLWDKKNESYKAKCLIRDDERILFNRNISERKNLLYEVYRKADKDKITTENFNLLIDMELNPDKYRKPEESFFEAFDIFLTKRKLSENRIRGYKVVKRMLQRYELFTAINKKVPFSLTFDYFTSDTIEDFESFINNEHTLKEEYKEIYTAIPEKRQPGERSQNRIGDILRRLRSFILWGNETERTQNNPFKKYKIKESVYGSPIYITVDERNKIYSTPLPDRPKLEIQKDIFVFQCLIGCRVGDMLKLKPENVINDTIEYIPRKTKDGRPVTVRIPLSKTAKEIIERYKGVDVKGRLLPFISEQKYNESIKEIFTAAEITRVVTVMNPKTREEEKRPINEIASSHMARRTFIGNIYKKVKDPNLIGNLSGHKEGSKAFARYRDIDDDIRKELIDFLE